MTKDSVYEILDPLTTLRKTRFWDWFDGNDLRSWWTKTNDQGINTFQMTDVIDGGFEIVTATTTNDRGTIDQGNINHYSNTAAIFISVFQSLETTLLRHRIGFSQDEAQTEIAVVDMDTATSSNIQFLASDAGGSSRTSSGDAIDANFHSFKLELVSASSATLDIDGVFKLTHTSNLPDVALPSNQSQNLVFLRVVNGSSIS